MTPTSPASDTEVIRLLARWVRELRRDNARLSRELDERRKLPRWFTAYHAWWLDHYATHEIRELAGELERNGGQR